MPGAAALAVWVGLWSFLPDCGRAHRGAADHRVRGRAHASSGRWWSRACFLVIMMCDWWVNRWLERRTLYVGSFAIVLAAFGGLELYGLNGALLFVLGAALTISIIGEIGPEEVAEGSRRRRRAPRDRLSFRRRG